MSVNLREKYVMIMWISKVNLLEKYQNLKEKDKDGNEVSIDWEAILRVVADNAFEYGNLTDQEIYNTIYESGGTDVQPEN